MENLGSSKRNFALPSRQEVYAALQSLTRKEWMLFGVLVIGLIASALAILQNLNTSFMVSVPIQGGSIHEGIVGTPRFVNPILAFGEADKDLTTLVYSGLMRKNTDGTLTPDLAESYEVTPNGLTYTFTLKQNIYFHDGKPVTVDDIVYTINQVKDPIIKSPKRGNWEGVEVVKIDERQVAFNLKQQYASFLENATLGIIPMHIWNNSSPIELNEANTQPIGSGPYQVQKTEKSNTGTIDRYELSAFKKFALGRPFIKKITLSFYQNEEALMSALEKGEINQASSLNPSNAEKLEEAGYKIESATLPRIFGLFFNQSQNQLFLEKSIIKAIDQTIDKDRIVNDVLLGFGIATDDPIPPNMIGYQRLRTENSRSREEVLQEARNDLSKDGWNLGGSGFLEKTFTVDGKKETRTLEFSIYTGNIPELAKVAELIREDLATLGMNVEVKTFDIGNLNQSVIRPRKYDVLLFGQIINNESDLFAFWHSSQIKDPGLNVALYTNSRVDKILEEAFVTADPSIRIKKYAEFEAEIKKDMPAVFLYSPNFVYVLSEEIQGVSIDHIASPQARFYNSHLWYINTDKIWKIFSK